MISVLENNLGIANSSLILTQEQQKNFWAKVDKNSSPHGCWLWTAGKYASGYGTFNVGGKITYSHRIAFLNNGGILTPENPQVLHDCPGGDNRACVNPAHLWAGNHKDNMQDKEQKKRGNHIRGTSVSVSKLNESKVLEIRSIYANGGISLDKLGEKYGVSHTVVGQIVKRKTWRHV